MEKVLQELSGRIFLGTHSVQMVLKYIWMYQKHLDVLSKVNVRALISIFIMTMHWFLKANSKIQAFFKFVIHIFINLAHM